MVDAYFQLFLTQNIKYIKRHISIPNKIQFQPLCLSNNTSYTKVQDFLSDKRKINSVLYLSLSFQRKTVLTYRKHRPKAEILCLPILPDDPTTNCGTASVILKILHVGGLLVANTKTSSYNKPSLIACNGLGKNIYLLLVMAFHLKNGDTMQTIYWI